MPISVRGAPRRMRPITVLVVDDSLFMRTLIADMLNSDAEIAVVATASSGSEALRMLPHLRPDCVILDLMMPGLDGLWTLKILMAAHPTPVFVFSAHSHDGADITRRCLAAGAAGYLSKPSGEMSLDIDRIGARLVEGVKGLGRSRLSNLGRIAARRFELRASARRRKLIVLGASTGGQPTLKEILDALPGRCSVPILVVQHSPNRFMTEGLAERLNQSCRLPVKVADHGETLSSGVVYLAPGGAGLTVARHAPPPIQRGARPAALSEYRWRHHFQVDPSPKNTLTPSIDGVMRSAALAYGANVLGIILSGMGEDGVEGMRAIKVAGGRTIVQDRSAVMCEMPQAVIASKLADEVLPAPAIARAIEKAART